MAGSSGFVDPTGSGRQWYDLFSRGARDWLRHNDKVRAAVRDKLPELIAGSELNPSADRTVQVPVRFLEHSRFRLRDAEEQEGVGQGAGKPGDQLVKPGDGALSKGAGGNEDGGYQFILELKIDDKDSVVRRKAASGAKVQIGKSGKFCGQSAVQMHGGMGVTDELSVSHYFKRLTMIDLMFGNQQHHLTRYSNLAMAA